MDDRPAYLKLPGLVRITIEGASPKDVLAVAHELTACHNITGPSTPHPIPGEPGVSIWQYGYAATPDG
ncbi:hypothetical protein V2W30_01705 [Streptomyces sp. Q6]|uniref:Uncharacterized protein n=1 Tax=Streptomyces citrinus TaxID=3118173 RepID=A0ACD5A5P1_9ACTN